jgi:methylase of polypeptide subunit release factors
MLKNILISKLFDIELLDVALGNYTLNETQKKELDTKLKQSESGIPLDYIIGRVNILGLELVVNEHTLIPREETEYWLQKYKTKIQKTCHLERSERSRGINSQPTIVEVQNSPLEVGGTPRFPCDVLSEGQQTQVDGVFKNYTTQTGDTVVAVTKYSKTLIDLGTGTGLIGLYLSNIYQKVFLLDIDPKTLEIAKKNIELNQKTNCQTKLVDGLENVEKLIKNEKWDLVANLPYLPSKDVSKAKEYRVEHEPAIALYSGDDGLELFNKVLKQIEAIENKPVNVLFELDPRNIKQAQINLNNLKYKTEIWLDQNGLERVLVGSFNFIEEV